MPAKGTKTGTYPLCAHCEKPFYREPYSARKFCSRACKHAIGRQVVPCGYCAAPIVTPRWVVRLDYYCSDVCRERADAISRAPIVNDDGTASVPLRDRDGAIRAYAIIDATDAAFVGQWRWSLDDAGYAKRQEWNNRKPLTVKLHRALLGLTPSDKVFVDHKDRNRLNDRRSNLRIVPKAANPQNRPPVSNSVSGYRNVVWRKERQRWVVQITVDGKPRRCGSFKDKDAAIAAARATRAQLHPYATD